ncbi:1,4-alpha-glucan branching enzyme GlgB [Anaerocolumna cellulosilytica]|uniref:1,4-alpha-glucan branching enzyme GlgB n=1 Tax=Anaerocolumna cellulosilytica TaxID=433286 RepID=A0A6S6QXY2_9FIRM|nr:1,4-alpha-glucan branching enzyme [Anaerocolumna cellulosilytica]BCJ94586.1 1,4-alpha-glucan branching enzyme GlgB [Anaerocolumna cellulosilytica]
MDDTLYDLMDWAEIETIVYSEHDNPHKILGAHITEHGMLINVFIPEAVKVKVKLTVTKKQYLMTCADKEGFYTVLIPGKKFRAYTLIITYDNHTEEEVYDPYCFSTIIEKTDLEQFAKGIHYTIYDILGAHFIRQQGVEGVVFAVWAPNAARVSVVGDFNKWDGRRHPMRRRESFGVFELFIPGLTSCKLYKYEIKTRGGACFLKADPYANRTECRPGTASVTENLSKYIWKDKKWMAERKSTDFYSQPVNIYELHLGSFKKPSDGTREFYNYRELAPMISEYVKDMGYTHVELLPVMEHPYDGSWGYQVTGYYAPTARYGTPDDFMYFIDYMHEEGIGVILDWVPAHFPKDTFGLSNFDGTSLYEHKDPKQGEHPHWGTLIYNYGRPEVTNFLIGNVLFWADKYHIDGIRMDAVASMLYLDYGKRNGEWIANCHGGRENLEALEFLKHLNSVFKSRFMDVMLIAEESTAWPMVTGDINNDGLGFDLKWNLGWMNDFTTYMKCDPLFRKGRHGELTFSMVYAYSEKFLLVLSHDEVVHEKGSMLQKMPGNLEDKFSNLRVAFGFMMCHPGKKLLFMGQEFAQNTEWNEAVELPWDLLNQINHKMFQDFVRDLNKFYLEHPPLFRQDFNPTGFEWIRCMDADHSILVFLRRCLELEQTLLVVCNFTPVVRKNFRIGVPFHGKYKEIFNSDSTTYGGENYINPRTKTSRHVPGDGREESIQLSVPPLGISIFTCIPVLMLEDETLKKHLN